MDLDLMPKQKISLDLEKWGTAWLGAIGVMTGMTLYMSDPKHRNVAGALFIGGWLVIAYAGRSKDSNKTMMFFLSVIAILIGAITSRQAYDKGQDAPMWAVILFLAGWLGVALYSGDYFKHGLEGKGLMGVIAGGLAVLGVYLKRRAEERGETKAYAHAAMAGGFGLLAVTIGA